jgi:hypothetical protein
MPPRSATENDRAPEFGSGVGVQVEKRGDENAHLVAEDLANEANLARRGGNFVIRGVLFAGGWERNDLLGQSGSAECLNGAEIEAIRSHAEMALSLQQGGEEPVGRVTARSSTRMSLRRSLPRCSKSI